MTMNAGDRLSRDIRMGYWAGMVFALLFFSAGAGFFLTGVFPNLWDAWRMQDWVQVPAEVEALDLKTNGSNDGRTYKVNALFRYHFNGQSYSSDRIGIADSGGDNIGDWQRDTHAGLSRQPRTTLWVNPANPAEAIYDRGLRWGLLGFKMVFVVVFGGIGAVWMWLQNRRQKPMPHVLSASQGKAERDGNEIRSNEKNAVRIAWGTVIFWNVISAPLLFALPAELAKGNYLSLAALLFPLIGLGLLLRAIWQTLDWRRYGPTLLHMDPFPGAIGGDVGGSLELHLRYNPKHRFLVTLTCQHVYKRQAGNSSITVHEVKWQDQQFADVQPGMRGTRLRFLFNPPEQLPQSSPANSNRYEWTVQITASLKGIDFNRSWEVPVFGDAGAQTARPRFRQPRRESGATELADEALHVRDTGAGLELYFPYLRHPGMAMGSLAGGAAFIGVAGLIATPVGTGLMTKLFLGVFAFFGVLLVGLGLYTAGNSIRVTAGRNRLRIERGIFGLSLVRELAASEISAIEKSIGMQSSRGSRSRAYYDIEVHTTDGRRINAGIGLPGASRVDAVITRIRTALE